MKGRREEGPKRRCGSSDGRRPAAYPGLPAGYDLYETLDMAADKTVFKRISWCSLLIVVVMIVCGRLAVSPGLILDGGWTHVLFTAALILVGLVVYVFAHEWVHGVFIRIFTGEPAQFGFKAGSGMAYAGSTWFFSRPAYITVALAPVVIWGVVLAVLTGDVPDEYFWCLYAIQIFNISGAVGDLYVTWLVMRMPCDVLIFDEGVSMKFFAPVKFD
ncbi:MAG: DUF3267 domain-containing protein [Anaerovoracaceae bacterium]